MKWTSVWKFQSVTHGKRGRTFLFSLIQYLDPLRDVVEKRKLNKRVQIVLIFHRVEEVR